MREKILAPEERAAPNLRAAMGESAEARAGEGYFTEEARSSERCKATCYSEDGEGIRQPAVGYSP